ncbi:MAG: uroporphyrinogen-III synthase [Aquificaceae bacterium]|jgi:uroporphyrinogen-III synthase|uniref:uroporphyrinogen-III synthase n=1 Tax=Hydrogenobacter sp. Uz 6-8 TaxID=3384828 RepID=UPI000F16B485|nr:MAG: uroporphyrinogen-III synthase [Aquificota bacterium]
MPLKVILTRSQEDIERDRIIFERAGFEVIPMPLIEEEPIDFEPPQESFDFVVFQSPRAVRAFFSKCRLEKEKIVVVGEKTRNAVEDYGYNVWAMPANYYGQEVLKLFHGLKGKVLVPKSAIGRDEVVEGLRALGFEVYALDVYSVKTRLYRKEEILEVLSRADAILFASPSAVRGLLANLQKEEAERSLKPLKVLCIGKTTKEFFESEVNLECLVPEKPSVEKVAELLKSMV